MNILKKKTCDHLVSSISCYKCLSINGSNPSCEDRFQGDVTGKPPLLSNPCLTYLRGRSGLFPATHCIKLIAYSGGKIFSSFTRKYISDFKDLILYNIYIEHVVEMKLMRME